MYQEVFKGDNHSMIQLIYKKTMIQSTKITHGHHPPISGTGYYFKHHQIDLSQFAPCALIHCRQRPVVISLCIFLTDEKLKHRLLAQAQPKVDSVYRQLNLQETDAHEYNHNINNHCSEYLLHGVYYAFSV